MWAVEQPVNAQWTGQVSQETYDWDEIQWISMENGLQIFADIKSNTIVYRSILDTAGTPV